MSRIIVQLLNCKITPSPLTVSNRAVIREGYFKLNWITMKRKNMLIMHPILPIPLLFRPSELEKTFSFNTISFPRERRRYYSNYTKRKLKALGSWSHNVTRVATSAWLCQKTIMNNALYLQKNEKKLQVHISLCRDLSCQHNVNRMRLFFSQHSSPKPNYIETVSLSIVLLNTHRTVTFIMNRKGKLLKNTEKWHQLNRTIINISNIIKGKNLPVCLYSTIHTQKKTTKSWTWVLSWAFEKTTSSLKFGCFSMFVRSTSIFTSFWNTCCLVCLWFDWCHVTWSWNMKFHDRQHPESTYSTSL